MVCNFSPLDFMKLPSWSENVCLNLLSSLPVSLLNHAAVSAISFRLVTNSSYRFFSMSFKLVVRVPMKVLISANSSPVFFLPAFRERMRLIIWIIAMTERNMCTTRQLNYSLICVKADESEVLNFFK
jgi:hypothetical protein